MHYFDVLLSILVCNVILSITIEIKVQIVYYIFTIYYMYYLLFLFFDN